MVALGLHSTTQILVVINFDESFQHYTLTQYTTPTSRSPPVHSSQMPLLCPLEGLPSKGYVCSPTMLPAKHRLCPAAPLFTNDDTLLLLFMHPFHRFFLP